MNLVDLVGLHVEARSGLPLVLLREHEEPHRLLPIFVGTPEAAAIALALSGQEAPRPLTHDVMANLVTSLDATVDGIEVTAVRDGTFLAELVISGPTGGQRLDTRPSDAIALAVRLGAPLFVSDAVLDEAGQVPAPPEPDEVPIPDDETIEAELAGFRDFLADVDASDFADPAGPADPADPAGPAGPADPAGPAA